MNIKNLSVISLAAFLATPMVHGQEARYELGVRVKRFEQLFEKSITDPAARKRVLPFLESAVTDFFTMRMASACRKLDNATAALSESSEGPPAFLPVTLLPQSRLLDQSVLKLKFIVKAQYGAFADPELPVVVTLRSPDRTAVQTLKLKLSAGQGELAFNEVAEGDYQIHCRAEDGGSFGFEQTVSFVKNLDERLKSVQEKVKSIDPSAASSLARTLKYRLAAIRNLQRSRTPETDVPVYELLTELEQWADAAKPLLGQLAGKTQQPASRVVLTAGRKSLPCRVSIPEKSAKGTATPLVIALHGAGGSENMFFEAYGAGKVVDLAKKRGWILVCPRISFLGLALDSQQIIASLESMGVAVDKDNVFVVGHSMGAGTTMKLASQPTPLRAIAALGGGGTARLSEQNKAVHSFVAAGDRDFGRGGASSLARSLKKSNPNVQYRTYENTEHLGIVQVALDDVFEFFEQLLVQE